MKCKKTLSRLAVIVLAVLVSGCQEKSVYYSAEDFEQVPKIDAHFHYNTSDARHLEFADSLKMWFVSPNVDAGRSIDEQFNIASAIKARYPDRFFFLGTFPVDNFGQPGFADETIERIDKAMRSGASGIKIWKNIGMVLLDNEGNYIMIDDPAFESVFSYLEENGIPVLGHLGEPLNCWLPLDEMTLGNDRRYFQNNPQYHMYLHPNAPSYEDQVNARDRVLERYPRLIFSGAHLASLEWCVDELAKRMDRYPNLSVDLSARIGHLQYQSLEDSDRVRDFIIRYQNRIMYGSDASVNEQHTDFSSTMSRLYRMWLNDWMYLATDLPVTVANLDNAEVRGLRLPKGVIDKIYYNNAKDFFK